MSVLRCIINFYTCLYLLCRYLEPDPHSLLGDVQTGSKWSEKYRHLTEAIGRLIEDYSLVRFYPLNIKDEKNVSDLLLMIDNMIQYGEEADVKTCDFEYEDRDDDGDSLTHLSKNRR